ncbi:MAG: acetate kinase [Lachnospiraceae bacterium]|nr:acetate kinase [Lachnospiraceae bacterium]
MKILVINCGSSSLKFQLIDTVSDEVLSKGLCERIGIEGGRLELKVRAGEKTSEQVEMKDHRAAVDMVLKKLTDTEQGVIRSLSEIDAVGHRVVHGGESFSEAVKIDERALESIEECVDLAPLHNPANLIGIRACTALMPGVPQVAVFDTAFHQTMPPKAYLYGIPYEYYEKYKIRRYGFHGTSHAYVSKRAAEILGRDIKELKIIVCHLGNGASICAVKGGKSVDTSMGLTPLEGLIMGTRSGDIDPGAVQYLMKKEGIGEDEVINILNKRSGVLGLSDGTSSDFRDLAEEAGKGNKKADTALEAYALRVAKYIGAYAAEMNGVDAIVFTAGAGENNSEVRRRIAGYLSFLGTSFNEEVNAASRGVECTLSAEGDKVTLLVIPTDEERSIAGQTEEVLKKG